MNGEIFSLFHWQLHTSNCTVIHPHNTQIHTRNITEKSMYIYMKGRKPFTISPGCYPQSYAQPQLFARHSLSLSFALSASLSLRLWCSLPRILRRLNFTQSPAYTQLVYIRSFFVPFLGLIVACVTSLAKV